MGVLVRAVSTLAIVLVPKSEWFGCCAFWKNMRWRKGLALARLLVKPGRHKLPIMSEWIERETWVVEWVESGMGIDILVLDQLGKPSARAESSAQVGVWRKHTRQNWKAAEQAEVGGKGPLHEMTIDKTTKKRMRLPPNGKSYPWSLAFGL